MLKSRGRKTLVIIAGPTAVGKTAVSIQLAKRLPAEIISADSRQIFRELTIGTAKPSEEELAAVKHHFINSHSISENYDAAQFGMEALACATELFEKYDYTVVCGGSGLYIKAMTEGFDDIPEIDPLIRSNLVENYETHGIGWLQQRMKEEDPEYFSVLDQNNPHRLIRALEVKLGTGSSISSFHARQKREHEFEIIKVGLELPREELYDRIDRRMDDMISVGLFEEAEQLYEYRAHNALQTVGYQEIFDYIEGKCDREEAIRLLKRNSRRYAKRQLTWFKRDEGMRWFHPLELDNIAAYIMSHQKPQ